MHQRQRRHKQRQRPASSAHPVPSTCTLGREEAALEFASKTNGTEVGPLLRGQLTLMRLQAFTNSRPSGRTSLGKRSRRSMPRGRMRLGAATDTERRKRRCDGSRRQEGGRNKCCCISSRLACSATLRQRDAPHDWSLLSARQRPRCGYHRSNDAQRERKRARRRRDSTDSKSSNVPLLHSRQSRASRRRACA